LRAHKWLILRRISQFGILGLFLLGPLAGIWIVKGNLNYSYTLGVLPLTDPYVALQSLATGHVPETLGLIGVAIVVSFYLLVGGRVYCSWVCPVNVVTDAAGWLRNRLGIKGSSSSVAQDTLLDTWHDAGRLGVDRRRAVGTDQSGVDAASRFDFWPWNGVDRSHCHFPVRPVRDEPRLVRPAVPGRRLLQPARALEPGSRHFAPQQRAPATTAWTASKSVPSRRLSVPP
jgi:hypothetical protein